MVTEDELKVIMDRYSETLLRVAYFYTKNAHIAEEIVQDVFVKFYYIKNYEERGELLAFLKRLTINASKDYLKSWHYRKIIIKEKLQITASTSVTDSVVRQFEEQMIEQAVLALSVKLREPIVYFYFENMKIREIAELLQLSEGTVKTRMTSAKNKLQQQFEGVEWEVLMHDEA